MSEQENPFDDEVVSAVVAHMNADHAGDSLVICRVFGGRPELTSAVMVGLDGHGADFDVEGPDGVRRLRVPWSEPISERPRIREEIARMFHEAEERSVGG